MSLLLDYIKGEPFHPQGIGMARPQYGHQRVMSWAHLRIGSELMPQNYEVLTEATVTDDWDDVVPDLTIFTKNMEPLCIIEIVTHSQVRADMVKCCELMERFPNAEYFVYDYEHKVLYLYIPEEDDWFSSVDTILYSRYLSEPMIEYFRL